MFNKYRKMRIDKNSIVNKQARKNTKYKKQIKKQGV